MALKVGKNAGGRSVSMSLFLHLGYISGLDWITRGVRYDDCNAVHDCNDAYVVYSVLSTNALCGSYKVSLSIFDVPSGT